LSGFWINLPIKLNKFDMSNLTKFNLKFYQNQQFTKLTHETGPGGADLEKMKQSQQSPCYKHKTRFIKEEKNKYYKQQYSQTRFQEP
jgi:hypothetical protein